MMLKKIRLPATELDVSALCYGTNMLGWMLDQEHSNAILDCFAGLGGNFLDTARQYGDWMPNVPVGASERAIGAWLKGKSRKDFVIATKGGHFDLRAGDMRNRVNPADLRKDLSESLVHLGVDSIDLYWVHWDNPEVPVAEIVDMLVEAQKAGKIRYFGASNWLPERIEAAQQYAKSIGHSGFVAIEPFWGLAVPNEEAAAKGGYCHHYEGRYEALHAAGMPVVPFSSQSRGFFTKMAEGGEAALSDELKAFYLNPTNAKRLQAVKEVAARHKVSLNEVVLAYLLNQPGIVVPIIGARTPEQLTASAKATNLKLTAAELAGLAVRA